MMKNFLVRIISTRIIQHVAFWTCSFLILVNLFNTSNKVEKIDVIYTAIFHVTLLIGVYINLFLLVPLLLRKGRYLLYIVLLGAAMIAGTALNQVTFDHLVDLILPGYFFISYYEFNDILKFFIIYTGLTTLLKLSKGWFILMETNRKLMVTEQEKIQNELKALKSQINPHFLFNSLNSIYSLALKKSKKTPEIILLLSDLMRYMIYESGEDRVPLKREISYMKNYIELQTLRSGKSSEVKINIQGEIYDQKIAPLLFLPFLENSFKHGIKGVPEGGFVHIDLNIEGQKLQLDIKNNRGFVEKVEKGEFQGIGLKNAKRRLELLYPGKYHLNIMEDSNSFSVNLRLEL